MNPERARALRDELRHRSHRHHGLAPQSGSRKRRELRFDKLRPEQAAQALQLLSGIEELNVSATTDKHCLTIHYDLTEFTLEGLEKALISQGFHFENSLFCKLQRALIYFLEDTQLRNMRMPYRLLKKSNEVYVKAWEHHPHGDHDDTPTDLREER
jgi:hypothetical protein